MKKLIDKKTLEREFDIGDLVYVKLQPYRQQSVVKRTCKKLAPKFFRLYVVLEKVGKVAYKLRLPIGAKIHPTFHVSHLKKHIGQANFQLELPLVNDDGTMVKEL